MNIVYQSITALRPRASGNLILVLACGAQLMVVLDGLIVNVALPQMRSQLGVSATDMQWVVSAYLVTFAGLLMVAARAADLVGHRRVFLGGIAVFGLASLVGGLAPDPTTLIIARAVQGAGAAALAPTSLSLLTATHTGERRTRALSLWSATSGSAGALGFLLGGIITSALGWRWVLLVNVPVAVPLWLLAACVLAPTVRRDHRRLDVPGATTVTAGVAALTYGLSQSQVSGWTSGVVVVALMVSVVMLGVFLIVERRSPDPLVPLWILRRRTVIVADTMIAGLGAVMTATLYFLSLYLQGVLGYSPLQTGLALAPMSVVLALGAIASKSLLPRFGARRLIAVGGVAMAAGLAWLSVITTESGYLHDVLGPTLVWAAGASIVTMPCVALATSALAADDAGLASGLVNTARGAGGAIGLAALATIAGAATAQAAGQHAAERLVQGYGVALIAAAAISVLVAVLAAAAPGSNRPLSPS